MSSYDSYHNLEFAIDALAVSDEIKSLNSCSVKLNKAKKDVVAFTNRLNESTEYNDQDDIKEYTPKLLGAKAQVKKFETDGAAACRSFIEKANEKLAPLMASFTEEELKTIWPENIAADKRVGSLMIEKTRSDVMRQLRTLKTSIEHQTQRAAAFSSLK
jgi:hypothetical protein